MAIFAIGNWAIADDPDGYKSFFSALTGNVRSKPHKLSRIFWAQIIFMFTEKVLASKPGSEGEIYMAASGVVKSLGCVDCKSVSVHFEKLCKEVEDYPKKRANGDHCDE